MIKPNRKYGTKCIKKYAYAGDIDRRSIYKSIGDANNTANRLDTNLSVSNWNNKQPLTLGLKSDNLGTSSNSAELTNGQMNAITGGAQFANIAGDFLVNESQEETEGYFGEKCTTTNVDMKTGGTALKGAGTGASIGTMIFPGVGTAIGAGVGAIAGGIYGNSQAKKENRKTQGLLEQSKTKKINYVNSGFNNRYNTLKAQGFNSSGNENVSMYPDGGIIDKKGFAYDRWRRILPDNLQDESPNYNLRGWWESQGEPEKFNNFDHKLQDDGLYHASSRDPQTGKVLKGKTHPSFYHGLKEDRNVGYATIIKNRVPYTLSTFKYGGYIKKFASGGAIPAEYEVEGEEIVQGTDVQLEGQKKITSDIHKAIGPTHEEGGVLGAGGERVFSNRLKPSLELIQHLSDLKINVPKKATYAKIAEILGKKKARFDNKKKEGDDISRETGRVMSTRYSKLLDKAFEDQEMFKQMSDMQNIMSGIAPQFATGGELVQLIFEQESLLEEDPTNPKAKPATPQDSTRASQSERIRKLAENNSKSKLDNGKIVLKQSDPVLEAHYKAKNIPYIIKNDALDVNKSQQIFEQPKLEQVKQEATSNAKVTTGTSPAGETKSVSNFEPIKDPNHRYTLTEEEEAADYTPHTKNELFGVTLNFLNQKGFNPVLSAAILGNVVKESQFKSNAVEKDPVAKNKVGYGLFQFTDDRKRELIARAKKKGVKISDPMLQLELFYDDMVDDNKEKKNVFVTDTVVQKFGELYGFKKGMKPSEIFKTLNTIQNPDHATELFMRLFERPKEEAANLGRRIKAARQYYDHIIRPKKMYGGKIRKYPNGGNLHKYGFTPYFGISNAGGTPDINVPNSVFNVGNTTRMSLDNKRLSKANTELQLDNSMHFLDFTRPNDNPYTLDNKINLLHKNKKLFASGQLGAGIMSNFGDRKANHSIYATSQINKFFKPTLDSSPYSLDASTMYNFNNNRFENLKTGISMYNKRGTASLSGGYDVIRRTPYVGLIANFAYGGKIKKYKKGGEVLQKISDTGAFDFGNIVNSAVFLQNLKNANKQITGIDRQTPTAEFVKSPNVLPYATYNINKNFRNFSKNIDRNVGSPQTSYAMKADAYAKSLNAINDATMKQYEKDMNVNNINTTTANRINEVKTANLNQDMLDRAVGYNTILTNKQNATNAFLQGIMKNMESKRMYNTDADRLAIASLDGGRGTSSRSLKALAGSIKDPALRQMINKMAKEAELKER